MTYSIRFAGTTWNHELAPIANLKYKKGDHGLLAASWDMALPPGFMHPALTPGKRVEIFYCGASRVGWGFMEEPDREEWKCTAVGSEFLAYVALLTIGGEQISGLFPEHLVLGETDPYNGARYAVSQGAGPAVEDEALVAQVMRHFDFTVDGTIPGGPNAEGSDADPALAYGVGGVYLDLKAALDANMAATGKRYVLDENGLLQIVEEPTTPTRALTPNVPGVGLSLDNWFSSTVMRYLHHKESGGTIALPDGTTEDVVLGIYWAAIAYSPDAWRWGERERTLAFDPEHQISEAAAQAIVDALQAEAVPAATRGVTLHDGQVTNLGGTPIALPLLKTNEMNQHFGVLDVPGARNVREWVTGHLEMDTTTGAAAITPRNVAPRTLAQVVQSINADNSNGSGFIPYDSAPAPLKKQFRWSAYAQQPGEPGGGEGGGGGGGGD